MQKDYDHLCDCSHNGDVVEAGFMQIATPLAGGRQGADAGDDLAKELAKVVEQIWKKKGMPKPSKKLTALYAQHFTKAIEEGWGKKIDSIDYDSDAGDLVRHLLENTYTFSAAKNYTQLRQLTQALIDEQGKLRTYSQYKQAAFQINEAHTKQWLKAEYDLAVSSSQMAFKWADIKKNSATKILEFDAVLDSKTSDGCRALNGVRKPVDDPFWNTYYPPNHFNCRSTVRQHSDGSTTPNHAITYPDDKRVPQMFRTNLGKAKLIFPPGHSYWVGTPVSVLKDALAMVPDNGWLSVENSTIRIHARVNSEAADFSTVMEVARDYASKGSKVNVLPTIDDMNDPLYSVLFKGAKKGKCPDLLIDETFVEVKNVSKMKNNTIKHSIDEASTQADHVIIKIPGRTEYQNLKKLAKLKFGDHKQLQVIEFKMQDAYYTFTRKQQIK